MQPIIISPDKHLLNARGIYVWSIDRVKDAWAQAQREYIAALPLISNVVLLMGIPAAGKTTWLNSNAQPDTVYFDATFDLAWKRKPYITAAHEAQRPVTVVWLDTLLATCLARNALRTPDRRVPDHILTAQAAKLKSAPPSESEGFTLLRLR